MIDQLSKNKVLVILAVVLLGYGLLKPNLNNWISPNNNVVINTDPTKVSKPTNKELLDACSPVVEALVNGSGSRKADGARLSNLYYDLATLIALDGDNEVIKSTLEVREANRLSGLMCRLNIGGKYPGLAEACNNLVVAGLGDKDVVLDSETRQKAVDTFMALSWACLEGSK